MGKLKTGLPYVILIGVAGLLIVGTLNTGQDWGGDFASYIMQAESLVEGSPSEFAEANRFTIEQSQRTIGPVAYPWGYPAMLAPVYAGFGQDMLILKSVGAVCYILFLTFLAWGFRKQHTGVWLWCLVGLFAVNPTMLAYLNRINSDVPFLFLSTLCVILIGKSVVEQRRFVSPGFDGLLLGVLIAAACLIRSSGVILLATLGMTQALVLVQLIRRRGAVVAQPSTTTKDLDITGPTTANTLWVNASPYVSFFAVMLTCRALLPKGGSVYMDTISQISLGTMWYHLTYYGKMSAEFYDGVPLPYLVYLASLPLAIVGVIRRWRSDHHMIAYIALSFSLYIVYPPLAGLRFLFPILPFYISFTLSGLEALQGGTAGGRPTLRRALCILPVVVVLVCFVVLSTSNVRENLNRNRATIEGPYTQPSTDMFTFIKQETDPGSTLVFYKPRVMRLMTGRKSYLAYDADWLGRADYLIVGSIEKEKQFSPQATESLAAQGLADRVYENSDFRVYRLTGHREGPSATE